MDETFKVSLNLICFSIICKLLKYIDQVILVRLIFTVELAHIWLDFVLEIADIALELVLLN